MAEDKIHIQYCFNRENVVEGDKWLTRVYVNNVVGVTLL